MNVDPEKRYNVEQIKNHPWFNKISLNTDKGYIIDYYDTYGNLCDHLCDSTKMFPEVWVVKCEQQMDRCIIM